MPAMAADHPQTEVFGGYPYRRFEGGENANGWNAAGAVNLNRWLGVTADFSGVYTSEDGVKFRNYTYYVRTDRFVAWGADDYAFRACIIRRSSLVGCYCGRRANVRASVIVLLRWSAAELTSISAILWRFGGAGGWDVVAQLGRHKQQQCPDLGRNRL
jgi:hypothetical protein